MNTMEEAAALATDAAEEWLAVLHELATRDDASVGRHCRRGEPSHRSRPLRPSGGIGTRHRRQGREPPRRAPQG